MNIQSILDFDKNLLISLQSIIPAKYSLITTIVAESIVIWVMILLVTVWLYGVYKKDNSYKTRSLQIFGLIISVFVIYTLINLCVPQWRQHPHEFLQNININPLIPHPTDNSFPSGHALFSAATIVAVWSYAKYKTTIVITIILAILTVCARVLGGVHYPGDIIGGLFFGGIGALFFRSYIEKIVAFCSPFILKIAAFFKL